MIWGELLAVLVSAIVAWCAGMRLARCRAGWMMAGVAALLLGATFIGHRWVRGSFLPPLSWVVNPWFNSVLLSVCWSLLMSVLLAHITLRRTRRLLMALAALMLTYLSVEPLVAALTVRPWLASMRSTLYDDGVCAQSASYTCGPASAVTCLHTLGVRSEEGELAAEAWCHPPLGVEPQLLAAAVSRVHQRDGIVARCGWYASLDDLQLPAVASMTIGGGHDIAVLELTRDHVTVGDPLRGKHIMTRINFMRTWTGVAITFERTTPAKAP